MSTLKKFVIYFLAAWSGFFVMSVELIGGRILSPYFGSSIFVWGGIITVFMLCLSVGYILGGFLSTLKPSLPKLATIILLEAALTTPIINLGDPFLDWLSLAVADPRYGSLMGAFALFGIPTIISGTISPYAIRLLINDIGSSGQAAGLVYFASTAGSAMGTILTSFYLVLYYGIDDIVSALIGTSLVIGGLVAVAASRKSTTDAPAVEAQ